MREYIDNLAKLKEAARLDKHADQSATLAKVTAERDELRALVKADHAARLAQVTAERDALRVLLWEVEHYVDLFHSEFDIQFASRIDAALKGK